MSFFQSLLTGGPPPVPPSYQVATFQATVAAAQMSNRELDLELALTGVDRARSWSGWFHPSNWGTQSMRLFGVGVNSPFSQQYALFINARSSATSNQVLRFAAFTDASNSIFAETPTKFLTNRWYHIAVTKTAVEANTSIEIYINGVQQAVVRGGTGTYTGGQNLSGNRFQVSRGDTTTAKYSGDMRDLQVWNRVLTQAEITELYNNGVPFDVNNVSFYASANVAYWPMRTTMNCLNNSAFNFTGLAGITYRTIPISTTYPSFTMFNAIPSNTKYVAFGGGYKVPGVNEFVTNTRSGNDHLLGGVIVKVKFHPSNYSVDAPIQILSDVNDIRGGSSGIINDHISVLTSTETVWPTFIDLRGYDSTDGYTGEAYGSPYSFTPVRPMFLFYGKVIEGFAPGEYLVPSYEMTTLGANLYATTINLWKRDALGNWTKTQMFNQNDGVMQLNETAILKVGPTTLLALSRREFGVGLWAMVSTDSGATWSAPVSTGLGTGVCMADMCLDANGRIVVVYGDRGADYLMISHSNPVADVLANLTDWKFVQALTDSYATDSTGMLGYPTIIADGYNLFLSYSLEFSSSRADLYMGYGLLGWGV